jgi:uracil-DNA glycosylase family 4
MRVADCGPFDAKILLVGEAPGAEEVAIGVPFVNKSGQLLKAMLRHSGIDYNKCYVTNVIQERPPNNKFEHFYEDARRRTPIPILAQAWTELQEKIKRLKPNIVLALGAEPLRAITNKTNLRAWRGIVMSALGTKVIATYHPANILRQMWESDPKEKIYNNLPIFEMDASKALRHSASFGYVEPSIRMTVKPTVQEVLDFVASIKGRVAIDIELVGHSIRCLSIATGPVACPVAIVIPFIKFQFSDGFEIRGPNVKILSGKSSASSYWSGEDELIVLDALNSVLTNSQIEKVGQNSVSFDAPIIKDQFKMVINNHYLDTMHAHHDLYSELPMGLDFLCSMYTDYPNYWTEKDTSNDASEWRYCGMDSIVTYVCSYEIENCLKAAGMSNYYFKHRHPLALALAEAQMEGIDIDEDRRNQLIKEQSKALTELKGKVSLIAGSDINLNSSAQMKYLLYEKMGMPEVYDRKTGKVSTDEKALRTLEKKYPDLAILDAIIMYRKAHKLISTYLKAKCDSDGKLRTVWNVSGTEGARISSSKTIWKTGLQMQNIPKGHSRGVVNIRDMFIAGVTKCICQEST